MVNENRRGRPSQGSSSAFDEWVVSYAHWVIRRRWWVLAATLLVAIVAASGMRFLGFSTDYRVFFSNENPQLAAFEALQNVYTKSDNVLFVLKPGSGDIFSPDTLNAVRALTDEAWMLPFATRVDSVTNFQRSFAEGDDFIVEDLVPKKGAITQDRISTVHQVALSEPLLLNRLVSADGSTTGVAVTLTMPGKDSNEPVPVMAAARKLAAKIRAEYPDLTLVLTGTVPLNQAFSDAGHDDLETLIPLMYGALVLVMFVLLRSIPGTMATVVVIGLSAATALGLAGWAGLMLTPPSVVAPTIILTIAIADSIHILITMFNQMRDGVSKRDSLVESLRINFQPIFLTSLTTVIGFLSLNFSDAPPFRDLGNITATGTAAAWVFSILFLPAAMAILPLNVRPRGGKRGDFHAMESMANFVIGHRKALLGGMFVLVAGLGALIPRIELNDQFVNYFDETIQFRIDTDFAMKNLSGIYQLQYSVSSGSSGGISDPKYLNDLDAFSAWLNSQPEVVHVQTMADIMKRLNRNLHGDDPSWYRLPDDRQLAAQYLLLYEMSLPYGLDLNNMINVDKSATQVIATLRNVSTKQAQNLIRRADDWVKDNFPPEIRPEAAGPFVMFAYISKRNIEGMLIGTTLALFLISGCLILALRSLKLGLVSLAPNLVPAVMAFGIWAVMVGQVSVASSVVAATSLGIIVDATVHFLSKYRRARRQHGESPEGAIRYAFTTVGTALWVTSTILVVGFAVLSLSAFELNQSLGLLTAITLVCALAADFLLLPAILLLIDKDRETKTEMDHGGRKPSMAIAE